MPYNIFRKGAGFFVYKVDDQGKPIGKAKNKKPYPSRAAAKPYLSALYAHEPKSFDLLDVGMKSDGPNSDYLVVEKGEEGKQDKQHLRVKRNGKLDHNLMGGAWAALHGGYRGNKYEGPDKDKALAKLRALYKQEEMEVPNEKSLLGVPLTQELIDDMRTADQAFLSKHFVGNENTKLIQKMHDLTLSLGAKCEDEENKSSDMLDGDHENDAQTLHDKCVGMGAKCKKEKMGMKIGDMSVWPVMQPTMVDLPYGGATSFEDIEAYRAALHESQELKELAYDFDTLVSNVMANLATPDKRSALAELAGEFLDRVSEDIVDEGFEAEEAGHKSQNEIFAPFVITNDKSRDHYTTIKSIGQDRLGSYAILWGSETVKDLTGEYFDPNTEELTAIFDGIGRLPMLYQHSLDNMLKSRIVGIVDTLVKDDVGLWYEAQQKMADDYDEMIKKLIMAGKLKTSTQTFPVARRVNLKGYIERWPIVEITATPTPAEPRMIPVSVLKSLYAEIGCDDFGCVLKSLGVDYEALKRLELDSSFGLPVEAGLIRIAVALQRERVALLDL